MSFDLVTNEQDATLLNAARRPSLGPEPGVFDNFFSGAGRYSMRGMAEAGRALDLAGAVFPMVHDAVVGGTENQDQYFKEHDELFNGAVDYWTPKPGEVGTAGQITGQLAAGVMQAIVSPALLVGTSALGSGEDLVREGVDGRTAAGVGIVQGAAAGVGLKLPFLGRNLLTRVLSGAGGNVLQGAAAAGASAQVLKAGGYDEQAQRFDPWDARGRVLDAMLGAAFGGMAHLDARLSPTDEAALLVANQARHVEDATPQGRPATDVDATMHANAMREALEQVLRGDRVAVDHLTQGMRLEPAEALTRQRTEVADEAARLSAEEAPEAAPIQPKVQPEVPATDATPAEHSAASIKARQAVLDHPDLTIPTARADADGNPVTIRASDAIALADAEAAHAQAVAPNVFKTAAYCLLGAL